MGLGAGGRERDMAGCMFPLPASVQIREACKEAKEKENHPPLITGDCNYSDIDWDNKFAEAGSPARGGLGDERRRVQLGANQASGSPEEAAS